MAEVKAARGTVRAVGLVRNTAGQLVFDVDPLKEPLPARVAAALSKQDWEDIKNGDYALRSR